MMDFSGGSFDPNTTDSVSTSDDDTRYVTSSVASVASVTPVLAPTQRLARNNVNAVDRNIPAPDVIVDDSLNDLLTPFGLATMKDRYLIEDETPQDRFANAVRYYANDAAHAQRMYGYISKLWCMPATPILSNGGNKKGNLISCFLNEVQDSLRGKGGIVDTWTDNIWMGAAGGGIGTYWGNVRGLGAKAKMNGKTSGAFSFTKVMDSLTACISQGTNRRGAAAVYVPINHPEIATYIAMRNDTGGDPKRKALFLHHGVTIPDAFMEAVQQGIGWDLICPKTGDVVETVDARELMQSILIERLEHGEPYILFTDNVNRAIPEHHKKSNLLVKTSNLCVEITLPTGRDHHGIDRTAVCCLFQTNLEKFREWKDDPLFILDCMYFLDNVLEDFIVNAGDDFEKSRYSAMRERSVGLGVMGFHSFLQSMNIPIEGAMAKSWNLRIFKHIHAKVNEASRIIGEERGACPDAAEHGIMERFSNKTAIAPTASVSIICGGVSAGIDIIPANVYTQKTLDGSFEVKNVHLQKILAEMGKDTREVWDSILENNGSVQHLDFLDDYTKDVYKTSFEVDQRWHVELAGDRAPYIDQSQSLNLAMAPDCHKWDLWKLHELAWKLGVKSLYYLRSFSIQRADTTNGNREEKSNAPFVKVDYDECLACQ
jgi:ribonucleoside-diphosphate reductase alpha chain